MPKIIPDIENRILSAARDRLLAHDCRDFSDPVMNWIGESVNILGMSLLLAGIVSLHRHGLESFEIS